MTFKKIAKEICKREGLLKSTDIAQVSEILGHLCDIAYKDATDADRIIAQEPSVYDVLHQTGAKRYKKKKKK